MSNISQQHSYSGEREEDFCQHVRQVCHGWQEEGGLGETGVSAMIRWLSQQLNYSSRSRMQWTISTSGAQGARATSTQIPTVSRYKTSWRRNMLQYPVLQVGGDIQMSLDINEAIKEDIQVSAITSKSTFRDFTLLWHSSLQFDTNTGDRGKWRWLGGKLRIFPQSMWTQPVFCGHFFLINTNIVHPTEECGFVFLNVWIKTLSSRSRILDLFLCFPQCTTWWRIWNLFLWMLPAVTTILAIHHEFCIWGGCHHCWKRNTQF